MKICCTMIVKNEAHVLRRCLESVLPLVDCICVCDTGSTDETERVFWDVVENQCVEAEYVHHAWENFGANRTQAFRAAERLHNLGAQDWHLVIDADDVLEIADLAEARKQIAEQVQADCLMVRVLHANIDNWRPQIFRADGLWEYRGPLHEAAYRLKGETEPVKGSIHLALRYRVVGGGARSLVSQEVKFRQDAALLKEHLRENPDDARAAFYLAQSLRDAGFPQEAIRCYLARAKMAGWDQERYVSLLQAGRLMRASRFYLGAVTHLEKAHLTDPDRAEAPFELAKLMCEPDWPSYWEANPSAMPAPITPYMWAEIAATRPEPNKGALFAEPQVWEWSKALAAELRGRLS